MIRQSLTLAALAGTFAALIATSPAPRNDCVAGTAALTADTTCGPSGSITVTSTAACAVKTSGPGAAAFPPSGYLGRQSMGPAQNAQLAQGFVLEQYSNDGGLVTCTATPADAGFAIHCDRGCVNAVTADGGTELTCNSTCDGALTP